MDVDGVLQFLRRNGLLEVELALNEDIRERSTAIESCDLERFCFPMNPPPPPVRLTSNRPSQRTAPPDHRSALNRGSSSTSAVDCSEDEFVSMGSSTTGLRCTSDFTNPYGRDAATQVTDSDASSDRLSQFGTARDYHECDLLADSWYDEKAEGYYLTPHLGGLDPFGGPSQDKFVTTSETSNHPKDPSGLSDGSEGEESDQDFQLSGRASSDYVKMDNLKDYFHLDEISRLDFDDINLKGAVLSEFVKCHKDIYDQLLGGGIKSLSGYFNQKNSEEVLDGFDYNVGGEKESVEAFKEVNGVVDEQETITTKEVPLLDTAGDEYEVFELRIIHRKNRTGFEENKEFPIVMNTMIAGRYYVTEYLGSAAFSKVVQAHDIQTGVDVCLKIIKNDKDFFDQSLDEIKLLKYVNKHDPGDEHHIIRLYDYFYHQEHLFIVCELLKANLYEFQKYNLESGAEPYFTMDRLQVITRQCLKALDFLHSLGIIHCDLKPENILIKSYRKCEIKVIDLGSSCFLTDDLSLYVQSRSYRAPEVILGLPYGPKIDVWSLGCILAELCSGEVLFPNDAVVMLLARLIALRGPIDLEMLLLGQETDKYFTREYDLYYIDEDTDQPEYIIPERSSLEDHLPVSDIGFIDFVKYLLQVNPKRRPTAKEALRHPWLLHQY